MPIHDLFPTPLYRVDLPEALGMHADIIPFLLAFARGRHSHQDQVTGPAYTGANSPDAAQYLHRMPELEPLIRRIHHHATNFIRELALDTRSEQIYLGRSWVNILETGGRIEPHNHMAALFSGVYYLQTGDSPDTLRFVDPKLTIRRDPTYTGKATPYNLGTVDIPIQPGRLLLFPGWLSHGMPRPHASNAPRITLAFDYYSVSLNGQSPPPPPRGVVDRLWKALDAPGD